MDDISFRTTFWSVRDLLLRFPQLRLDPDYQREGNIWSLGRRQLFIDSVLNGFDSPKLYLHVVVPPEFQDESLIRFAVIDGRQRLEALRSFAKNEFPLAKDFRLLSEMVTEGESNDSRLFDNTQGGEFAAKYLGGIEDLSPGLARRFYAYSIAIVMVETSDLGLIEELFFRLNEGSPLNAAEKRNRGTLLREALDQITRHDAFERIRILNRRGRHADIALRFMYFKEQDADLDRVPDMRASQLDRFAAQFRPPLGQTFAPEQEGIKRQALERLNAKVIETLDRFAEVFQSRDRLLRLSSDVLMYFVLFSTDPELTGVPNIRGRISEFFERLWGLQWLDETVLTPDELTVLDTFGDVQGTTTGSYVAVRATLLWRFLKNEIQIRPAAERLDQDFEDIG